MSFTSFCRPRMRGVVAALVLALAVGVAASRDQMFTGEITDSKCAALGGHPSMLEKGETNAHCTLACVRSGAKYVLADPKDKAVYTLDNPKKAEVFAGYHVVIVGSLDEATKTLHLDDIVRALPPGVNLATTAAVVCDGCPRGMDKAVHAAVDEITAWKRFTLIDDPHQAQLVFLFSANRYLGDYRTRVGPDKRPVKIDTTYLNVIDPRTGSSLWDSNRRAGSMFVAGAAKDLIDEFREQLEADDNPAERQAFVDRHCAPGIASYKGK